MTAKFVHLRVHTDFSLENSLVRIKDLTDEDFAKAFRAVAVTDNANIFGAVKFYEKSRSNRIKPIIGSEIHIESEYGQDTIVALCKNEEGYKNLMIALSQSYTGRDSSEVNPTINLQDFLALTEGLIVLSGGNNSLLFDLTLQDKGIAQEYISAFKGKLGEDYFVELQRVGMEGEADYISDVVNICANLRVPVVATNNVMFMKREDYSTHEIRAAIPLKKTLKAMQQGKMIYTPEQHMKSQEEMLALFSDIPSACANTVQIAKKCNFTMELGKNYLPEFPVEDGYNDATYLEKLSFEGLEERLLQLYPDPALRREKRSKYEDRLRHEINVINNMGFPGYFLIVMEFIQWSKDNGVPVGPGRGSGAGSLVAYALKITDLDPLAYDLLFERFLNPERVSMPDFDIDFCQQGRDKVIAHVADFYGKEAVSQIITFGTMAARSVVKDVARTLGYPYSFGDRISKLIPNKPGTKLADAINDVPALQMLRQEDAQVAEILGHALKLEGLTRQTGKHAGGVLISPSKISDFSPIYSEHKSASPVSHFDKDDVEKRGLVKFDFLGLKTLSVIQKALDFINAGKEKGDEILTSSNIPLDDKATYELLQDGNTTGVFQLESTGMKNLVQRLAPENFEEIIALVALYRPGPLDAGMVDTFINCKKGIEEIHYPHPSLESILDVTNGVFVYQEQVMQAAQIMAKYSLGEADLLRRAMGKKKPEEMAKQRVMFTEGAVSNGISEDDAKHVFDLMETFAGYGFNKSHSASYAVLSVVTAYIKQHYPAPFYAATLSYDSDDTDKVVKLIHDAKDNSVEILPPDINKSYGDFCVDSKGRVMFGLSSISGVGDSIREKIIEDRRINGEFNDIFDFMVRTNPNIRVLLSCIYSGAFDCFGDSREKMHSYAPYLSELFKKYKNDVKRIEKSSNNTEDLLGSVEIEGLLAKYRKIADEIKIAHQADSIITPMDLIREERKRLGLYMSKHPNDSYALEVASSGSTPISVINDYSGQDILQNEKEQNGKNLITIAGAIVDIEVKNNKKSQTAMVTIDDGTGQKKIRLTPKLYNEIFHMLELDDVIFIDSYISYNPNNERFFYKALSVKDINTIRQENVSDVRVRIDLSNKQKADGLREILKQAPKGIYKFTVEDISSPNNTVHQIRDGRDVSDEMLQRIRMLTDRSDGVELVFKERGSSNKVSLRSKFEEADEEVVLSSLKRANQALRAAREVMSNAI